MTTYNITVTNTWTQLATTSDTDLLVTFDAPVTIEVATTTANSVPTVKGHLLTREDQVTRAAIGSGYVWARVVAGSVPSSIVSIVSK